MAVTGPARSAVMCSPAPDLRPRVVPLSSLDEDSVRSVVRSITEGLPQDLSSWLLPRMLARRPRGEHIEILVHDGRPAGWWGWATYPGLPGTWESTTYFAPPLRGTGLFARALCRQAHLADGLALLHGPQSRFVSSIASWNVRSLGAHTSYARRHGWPPLWREVDEPDRRRTSHVLTWPTPAPHTCHEQPGAPR